MSIGVLDYKPHQAGKYITPLNISRCKVRIKRIKSVSEQDDDKRLKKFKDYNNFGLPK